MSTNLISTGPYTEYDRTYLSEMIDREVYSIILTAFRFRREFGALTQNEVATRTGKNKTWISDVMRGPANREMHTLAIMANAMDMDVVIGFVDRADPSRIV